ASSRRTAPSDLAAEKRTLASRKIRIRRRSAAGPRLLLSAQDLLELGFSLVEFADPLVAVDLDRQRDGGAEEQPFGRRLRDELVVGLDAEGLAELGRQGHDAASADTEGGFHEFSMAETQQCRKAADLLQGRGMGTEYGLGAVS